MSTAQVESKTARQKTQEQEQKPAQEIHNLASTKTTLPHRRIALAMSVLLLCVGIMASRYAKFDGSSHPEFAVMFTILTIFAALLTANLLLGQFLGTRLPSLAILGGVYLYVGLINVSYLLTLPKVFALSGLFNAGSYAPNWLWIFWQIGYSLGIFVYVVVNRWYTIIPLSHRATKRVYLLLLLTIPMLAVFLSFIAVDPYHMLPNILSNAPPPVFVSAVSIFVFSLNGLMCLSAFFLLHSRNVLHLWLRVSILASFINVSLSLYTGGRYSVGWYAARTAGLMTSIFVLYALLHEVNKIYIKMAHQNEELAIQNRIQSDFLSVVGHEFRTALTGILGFSEMIREGGLDEQDTQEYADDIHNDAIRLTRLINDLLDLERMKSGYVEMKLEQVEINVLIQEIVGRMYVTASQKDRIQLNLDADVRSILADPDKLTQVITNLINNAIKYSPEGGNILIESKSETSTIHFFVQDFGIGIPTGKLEQVFERYARVESGATRYIGGTGLGLPIVRQIVEMHQGTVWAESSLGKGSTFHVVLPVQPLVAK